jgi:thioredoxin-related protein
LAPRGTLAAEPSLSEDGLHIQPWFLQSFLELREDFQAARNAGKTLVLLWELKGCPYCKLLHTESLSNAKIAAYAMEHFEVLQLNIVGSRPVTDFDGEERPEKYLAAHYHVRATPALQFFAERDGKIQEVGRSQYLPPSEFFAMLRFITEKGYETMSFDAWLQSHPVAL